MEYNAAILLLRYEECFNVKASGGLIYTTQLEFWNSIDQVSIVGKTRSDELRFFSFQMLSVLLEKLPEDDT